MADKTLNQVFGEIADAIREKNGSESAIKPINMAQEIAAIPTAPTLEGYYILNDDGLNWFNHATSEGTCCWWLSLHEQIPVSPGLMYVNTGSYAPGSVNLEQDHVYIYKGDSEFDDTNVSHGEYYKYDSASGFASLSGLSNTAGIYYFNGDMVFSAKELVDNKLYYFDDSDFSAPAGLGDEGIYYYTNASGKFESCAVNSGSAYMYDAASHIFRPIEATMSINDNGTYDVQQYASVEVSVSGGSALAQGLWYSDAQNTPSSISLENRKYYYYYGDSRFTKAFDQEGVYYYSSNTGLKFLVEYDTSGVYYLGASDIASYKFNLNSGSAYIYNPGANPALTPVTATLELGTGSDSTRPVYVNQPVDVTQYKYFKVIAEGKWFTVDIHTNKLTEHPFDENEIGYFDYYRAWHSYSLDYGHVYRFEGGSDLKDCYLSSGSTYIYNEYGFEAVSGEGQRIYYYGAYGMTQSSISGDYFLCFKDGTNVMVCDNDGGMETAGDSAVIDTQRGTYKVIRLS